MGLRRYGIERLGRWLWPASLGPMLGAWLLAWARTAHGGGGGWSLFGWLALGSAVAGALTVSLVAVDFLLLLFRLRTPPTGRRGWLSSAAAPLPFALLWQWFHPPLLSSPARHVITLAALLLSTALIVRLVASPKPGRGIRFG
ncbi:MAG: hypothetical protein KC776_26185 [Myxococcales bacterium]|nr:hypothetical protein [Myxococcales bacterium]MCB9579111.1 hypothetical protein [Polyangiaceae bacterium]